MKNSKKHLGFTLVEILIVIGMISILATIIFVSLKPLERFQDSRNSKRTTDLQAIVEGIKYYQVDNQGEYPWSVDLNIGENYLIGENGNNADCSLFNCEVALTDCVDISELVSGGYLPSLPFDPNDDNVDQGDGFVNISMYYLRLNDTGSISVGPCVVEAGSNLSTPVEITK